MDQSSLVDALLVAALECSIYHSPTDPWFTYEELMEVGKGAGFLEGELHDAIARVTVQSFGGPNKLPPRMPDALLTQFAIGRQPEYRNFEALDFVVAELNLNLRQQGAHAAGLERSVVVESAVAKGLPRLDTEAAITILSLDGPLLTKDEMLQLRWGRVYEPLPGASRRRSAVHDRPSERSTIRPRAYEIVKDVVSRRTDGRARQAEPMDAFADAIEALNYKPFRLWWMQTTSEFRRASANSMSISTIVLAAALVEEALTFVVRHAQARNVGPLLSRSFTNPPCPPTLCASRLGCSFSNLDCFNLNRKNTLMHSWLRKGNSSDSVRSVPRSSNLHTYNYYNAVNAATGIGLESGGRPGVSVALAAIRATLVAKRQFP